METPNQNQLDQQQECCPRFDPEPWENIIHEWDNKRFIIEKVRTLFFAPINFGKVMTKIDKMVKNAGASITDNLVLSDHTSKWNMNIYIAIDHDLPDTNTTTLSGKYLSKVYEGDFKETGKWCEDFEKYAKSTGLVTEKIYMWYTTCPKCAKKYGKNYVVIIAKVNLKP